MELAKENAKEGLVIVNKEHPNWGTFVLKDYDSLGWWEISNGRGRVVLCEGEFKFWKIAK